MDCQGFFLPIIMDFASRLSEQIGVRVAIRGVLGMVGKYGRIDFSVQDGGSMVYRAAWTWMVRNPR